MVIINNQHHQFHFHGNRAARFEISSLPEWQQKLHELMQYYIARSSPKTLGRELRNLFLLRVAEFTRASPDWEELVLHMMAMLELIDQAEDAASMQP
jgi:hypothetical protein